MPMIQPKPFSGILIPTAYTRVLITGSPALLTHGNSKSTNKNVHRV